AGAGRVMVSLEKRGKSRRDGGESAQFCVSNPPLDGAPVRRRRTLASRSLGYAWSWAMVLPVWSVGGAGLAGLAPTSSMPPPPSAAVRPETRRAGAGTG